MKKAGLVLEGGAMRGIFTAGVLDVLMEEDCWFPYVVGVSAGSSNALDYVSRQVGRTRDCMAMKDKTYRCVNTNPLKILRTKEVFDLDLLYNRYPNELFPFDYETYFQSEIACELVVTNCLTGQADYLDERQDKKRLMDIIAASSDVPVLSHMVEVDGTPCLDGGIADSIPLIHSMKKGYRKNVLVLTREKGYRKKTSGKVNALYRLVYRKYPQLVETLCSRAARYNRTMDLVEKWEAEGKIFVIRPQGMTVGRTETDYDRLMEFYQHGYDRMKECYRDMLAYLEAEEKPEQAAGADGAEQMQEKPEQTAGADRAEQVPEKPEQAAGADRAEQMPEKPQQTAEAESAEQVQNMPDLSGKEEMQG